MSCSLVFSQLIKEVGEWSQHNFGNQKGAGALAPLAGIVEEIGELQEATTAEDKIDAFVDMTIFLADVCARSGVVVHHTLLGKYGAQPFKPEASLGKLSHAVLKLHQGIRGAKKGDVHETASQLIKDIVRGYYHSLSLVLGNAQKVEPFDEQVEKVWNKVKLRDWKKWPETGRPPEPASCTTQVPFGAPGSGREKTLSIVDRGNSAVNSFAIAADLEPIKYKVNVNYGPWLSRPAAVAKCMRVPESKPTTFEKLADPNGAHLVPNVSFEPRYSTARYGAWEIGCVKAIPVLETLQTQPAKLRNGDRNLRSANSTEIFKRVCEYPTREQVYVESPAEFKTPKILDGHSKRNFAKCPVLSTYNWYYFSGLGTETKFRYDCYGYYK